jgi:DNA-binding response OmpR family regulator
MPASPPFSVLVVEDDPVCRRFAVEVLRGAGYATHEAGTLADAVSCLGTVRCDAILSDVRLPDGHGTEFPARARISVPLLAMSADLSVATRAALALAGYAGAVEKPLRAATLLDAVAAVLERRSVAPAPQVREPGDGVLDDEAALAAAGTHDVVAGLRSLLRAELPKHRASIEAALQAGDAPAVRGVLHQLHAACGFCGAGRLAREGAALGRALGATGEPAARGRFLAALDDTVAALDATANPRDTLPR